MRKKSMLTSAAIFSIVGVLLLIFKQIEAGIIALGFAFVMAVGVGAILLMEFFNNKKLDPVYAVRRKEFIVKDYEKLAKSFDKEKFKALSLVVLKLTHEHDEKTLKLFGRWLKEAFASDPIGYDEGYIIVFVNIHENLMPEMIKQMRKRLKELRLGVSFKSGYAYYTGNEDFETLKNLAEESIE